MREEDGEESLSASLEQQEQKSERIEETKLEDVKEAIDGNREAEDVEESNNSEKERKGEEEKKRASHETRVSSEQGGNKPEVEEELIGNSEDKENQIIKEDRSNQTIKDLQEELQQRGDQEEEKEKKEVGPPRPNTAEEKQEQEVDLQPEDSQSHANEEPPQKPSEEAAKTPSSPAPKVLSALARFQVHSQGFQVNTRTKELAENRTSERLRSREKVQTPANKSEKSSDEEEELPLFKVSELKKRFEA